MNIRSDVLARIARSLDVSSDELLGTKASPSRATKPAGKARQTFEAVSRLPRRQQQKIIDVVEALIAQHANGNA